MDLNDYIFEYDKIKTKILKYIIYKKRTEKEVRQKFEELVQNDMLDNIIQELKENGYIDDNNYIERAVQEFKSLKNMSIKEMRYKLLLKGLNNDIIDEYISNNIDDLMDYELKSIKNIFYKKQSLSEEQEIKQFLLKKGYKLDNINSVLSEVQWCRIY